MKKSLRMLALLLSLLLTLTGFAAAEQADEMLLATVDGAPVAIDDAYAEYEMYANAYETYGFSESSISDMAEDVADYYIRLHLIYAKAEELGLVEQLDEAIIQAEGEQLYEECLEMYLSYFADAETGEEENRAYCIGLMEADGYTQEQAYEDAYHRALLRALVSYCSEGVAVTDEEVRANYDETLADQIKRYGEYISNFESDWKAGRSVYYIPEGVRYVKHILVSLSQANQSDLYNYQLELSNVESQLTQEDADVETLTARKEELEQLIENVYAIIMPEVEEIQGRIEAGEDFLTLMDEYGDDTGMQPGSSSYENGYMVWENCSSWVAPFTDGSMGLEKVGDVSEPVRTRYGIHLIRYESDLEARTVPFDEVQQAIYEEMLNDRMNDAFMARLAEWEESAEIVRYTENLELMRKAANAADTAEVADEADAAEAEADVAEAEADTADANATEADTDADTADDDAAE